MNNTNTSVAKRTPTQELKETIAEMEVKSSLQQEIIFDFEKKIEVLQQSNQALTESNGILRTSRNIQAMNLENLASQLEKTRERLLSVQEVLSSAISNAAIDAYEAKAQQIRTAQRHDALVAIGKDNGLEFKD